MTEAITLHIDGMTCGSCAEHVKQTLKGARRAFGLSVLPTAPGRD